MMTAAEAARLEPARVLERLGSGPGGLTAREAARRLAESGPNAIGEHRAGALAVAARQLRNPLLAVLIATAVASLAVGQATDARIVLAIVVLSVGLGFVNEYRSERVLGELRARVRRTAAVTRDGVASRVDATTLVPGDVVRLEVGDVVPADLRLLRAVDLECDEAVITGEPLPASKDPAAIGGEPASPLDLPPCAFMGTVVRSGSAEAVVVATGGATLFGGIARSLGRRAPVTRFQLGLADFSALLVRVTVILTGAVFALNAVFQRPILEAFLFALAIAVGLTPQLLPAIVTVSLSVGARRLAARDVLVKRLVSIEDLGDVEILFTDKTGTLTEGRVTFREALAADGAPPDDALALALLTADPASGSALDRALRDGAGEAAQRAAEAYRPVAALPFDYERRIGSVLADGPDGGRLLVAKGAPEAILARCGAVSPAAQGALAARFAEGARVLAVASRPALGAETLRREDERDLTLRGYLVFSDPPKPDAAESVERLRRLGIAVKIVTGDNPQVAAAVCAQLGLAIGATLTGREIDGLDDAALGRALAETTIFARVTPEQKSRVIRVQRELGADVAFLGDGVNDAVALHDADVGISVDAATDVAKDAADIVLLAKDLDVLADGVVEGRRIFTNTVKYVLMATSSNFGNMFSAAGASLVLSFLPMLPSQVLLNNLLYDASELTIPSDRVDEELLERPARWDTAFIRRFMLVFGPISSIFDFATFAVMLMVFRAGPELFRTGWFVESLATQTLVIFVIRTRRVPFFTSRPGTALLCTSLATVAIGTALPFTPLAPALGFTAFPLAYLAILAGMIALYLALIELAKTVFYGTRAANQSRASRAASSSAPGSSNRCVAPGTIASSLGTRSSSSASRFH